MLPADKKTDAAAREKAIYAENLLNRSIIADAIKQMVLVVISLGFSNAFTNLSKQPPLLPSGLSLEIFVIYILIGTRFLLTSWLYLSTTYRDTPNSDEHLKKLNIEPDAVGISLTGILIGVQSSYATVDNLRYFFCLFCLVLFVDVVSSAISLAINREVAKDKGLRHELYWILNNAVLGAAMFVVIVMYVPLDPGAVFAPSGWPVVALMIAASLNCLISLGISWCGYFRPQR